MIFMNAYDFNQLKEAGLIDATSEWGSIGGIPIKVLAMKDMPLG